VTYRAAARVDELEQQAVNRLPNSRTVLRFRSFPTAKTAYTKQSRRKVALLIYGLRLQILCPSARVVSRLGSKPNQRSLPDEKANFVVTLIIDHSGSKLGRARRSR
jgi:hypothetical protein